MDTIIDTLIYFPQSIKYLDDYGIHVALILSGMFGAFVMMGKKDELTFWQRFVAIISGGAIANYLTPLVFKFLNLPADIQYGLGFLLGYGGLESVKWLMFKFKEKYGDK